MTVYIWHNYMMRHNFELFSALKNEHIKIVENEHSRQFSHEFNKAAIELKRVVELAELARITEGFTKKIDDDLSIRFKIDLHTALIYLNENYPHLLPELFQKPFK